MSRLNVLFVIPQMGMGGSERLVHNLARRLDKTRFNTAIAWLHGEDALQEFRDLRVPLHHLPKIRRFDFSTMRQLAKTVERERIDIVNAQHFMPAVYSYYACNLAAKKALVFTAHSRWEVEGISLKWKIAGGFLLRRISASVGVASDVSGAVQSVFKTTAARTLTIENGVDIDLFSGEKDIRGLKSSLGLSEGDILIGIVANLKKVKNHQFLFKAFSKIAEECNNAKLLVIGQGFSAEPDNTEHDLRLFVKNSRLAERVLFLGYRTDIPRLLQAMDVFCLPSLREGLPIALIEAMAAGLPVVGTNVEGIRDLITPNVDGVLVDLGDEMSLKGALDRLLRDPQLRQRLGTAGREKAMKRYSLQRCVGDYERLFLSLAGVGQAR